MRFRLKRIIFFRTSFDLTGDERIHLALYRRQQIDIGLRYMKAEDEAVARFRIVAVQSKPCFPPALLPGQAVWLLTSEGQSFRMINVIDVCSRERVSCLYHNRTLNKI